MPLDAGFNDAGAFFDLLRPYALLGGLASLLLFITLGLAFVSLKTERDARDRVRLLAIMSGVVTIVVAASFLA